MKIAVISDLHTGEGSRAAEFCLEQSSGWATLDYIKHFKEFILRENLSADILLIAGDISNRAKEEEYNLASNKIKEIASILSVPDCNVFYVPGNHDACWVSEKKHLVDKEQDTIDFAIKKKYDPINNGLIFKEINQRVKDGCLYKPPYAAIWESEDVIALGVNTAAFDHHDTSPHHGKIRFEDLDEIKSLLSRNEVSSSNKTKIILMHHHPLQYTDSTFNLPDLSALINAEGLINIAGEYEFNYIVHGHKHIPRVTMRDVLNHPLTILCAGSFSAKLDDRYFQGIGNSFHLIEEKEKCNQLNTGKGIVKSWAYLSGHKWIPSEESREGISYLEYYGCALHRRQIMEIIECLLKEVQYKSIKSGEIFSKHPELFYCSRKVLYPAIKDTAEKLGLDFLIPSKGTGSEEFYILRGQ